MIDNKQFALLKDKLDTNQTIFIDVPSVNSLFKYFKKEEPKEEHSLFKLICERNLREITSICDVIREAASENNVMALKLFTELEKLHPSQFIIKTSPLAMDEAIRKGQIESVEFLRNNRTEGFTRELAAHNACRSINRNQMVRYILDSNLLPINTPTDDSSSKINLKDEEKSFIPEVILMDSDLIHLFEKNDLINYSLLDTLFSGGLEFSPLDPKFSGSDGIKTYLKLIAHKREFKLNDKFKNIDEMAPDAIANLMDLVLSETFVQQFHTFSSPHFTLLEIIYKCPSMDDKAILDPIFSRHQNVPGTPRSIYYYLVDQSIHYKNFKLFKMTLEYAATHQIILDGITHSIVFSRLDLSLEYFKFVDQFTRLHPLIIGTSFLSSLLLIYFKSVSIDVLDDLIGKTWELIQLQIDAGGAPPGVRLESSLITSILQRDDPQLLDLIFQKYRDCFNWPYKLSSFQLTSTSSDLYLKQQQLRQWKSIIRQILLQRDVDSIETLLTKSKNTVQTIQRLRETQKNLREKISKEPLPIIWSSDLYLRIHKFLSSKNFRLSFEDRLIENGLFTLLEIGDLEAFIKELENYEPNQIVVPSNTNIWTLFARNPDFDYFELVWKYLKTDISFQVKAKYLLELMAVESLKDSNSNYCKMLELVRTTQTLNFQYIGEYGLVNVFKYLLTVPLFLPMPYDKMLAMGLQMGGNFEVCLYILEQFPETRLNFAMMNMINSKRNRITAQFMLSMNQICSDYAREMLGVNIQYDLEWNHLVKYILNENNKKQQITK
eukprot:gene4039-5056_t